MRPLFFNGDFADFSTLNADDFEQCSVQLPDCETLMLIGLFMQTLSILCNNCKIIAWILPWVPPPDSPNLILPPCYKFSRCMQLWQKFPPLSTEDKAFKFGFSQLSNAYLTTTDLKTAWWDFGGSHLVAWLVLFGFFFVVVCWKEQKWQRLNSFPQFLPASETVLFHSKHKWKCSCSKWISRLCHSETERGKQDDHCCLIFAFHNQTFLLATALIILLLF